MRIKYLLFFILIISCKSQQNKNIYNRDFKPIFTTSEWRKIVINALEQQLEASQKQQYRILEHINFIKSKDDCFLEKQFSVLGLKNKTFNSQNDFTLIINFSNTEGPYEYLYLINEKECSSYFLTDGKKAHSKKVKDCETKLNGIKSLKNFVRGEEFAFDRDLLVIWELKKGKYELKIFHEVTGKQLDLVENIFYDSDY